LINPIILILLTKYENISIVSANEFGNNFIGINNIYEINYLEYFIEFQPKYNNIKTTNYTIYLNNISEDLIGIHIDYSQPQITGYKENLNYSLKLYLNEWRIVNFSNIGNKEFAENETSELFAEILIPMKTQQLFRVDEFLTFIDFIKIPEDNPPKIHSISRNFEFKGLLNYTRNLKYTFEVYYYYSEWSFYTNPSSSCG